jgi:hypothetical protein
VPAGIQAGSQKRFGKDCARGLQWKARNAMSEVELTPKDWHIAVVLDNKLCHAANASQEPAGQLGIQLLWLPNKHQGSIQSMIFKAA